MRTWMIGWVALGLGCQPKAESETTPDEDLSTEETAEDDAEDEWWEEDVADEGAQDGSGSDGEDDEDKPDDTGDKPDDEGWDEIEDCGDDFDSTAPCEGDWKDTMCTHEDLLWWCEDGEWTSEEEKPQ